MYWKAFNAFVCKEYPSLPSRPKPDGKVEESDSLLRHNKGPTEVWVHGLQRAEERVKLGAQTLEDGNAIVNESLVQRGPARVHRGPKVLFQHGYKQLGKWRSTRCAHRDAGGLPVGAAVEAEVVCCSTPARAPP